MNFFISEAIAEAGTAATDAAQSPLSTLLFFGGMIALFYFILIRPQQKRAKEHRNLVAAIGKGDEIITNSGMLGKVLEISDLYVSVEFADNVVIRMQKSAVTTVLPKGTIKAALKD
ncbi:MAG: preprotein translocase subunit YajC [Gammaproteobacteria bacterium]